MRAPLQTERQRGRVTHVYGTHAPPMKLPLHGRGAAKPSPAFPTSSPPCHKRAREIPGHPLLRPPLPSDGREAAGSPPPPWSPRVSTTRFPLGRANNLPEGKKRGLWGRTPSPSARRGTQLPKGAWSATLNAPRPVGDATSMLQGRSRKIADGLRHPMTTRLSLSHQCDGMGVVP